MSPTPRLVTIPFSHFCEKARWALDYAGVRYDEEGHAPAAHIFAVKRAGGARTVPCLVTSSGILGDSRDIVRFADAQAPDDRKLLPASEAERREVDALEAEFDHDLGPHLRRLLYFHVLARKSVALDLFARSTPPREVAILRALFPVVRLLMRRSMNIDARSAARSYDVVRRVFDSVGARLADGRPYLVGDRFTSADLTFAALASPGLRPAEHPVPLPDPAPGPDPVREIRDLLRGSPGGKFALTMYRQHRAAPVARGVG
jgi:glutathione S-transferase